MAGMIDGSRRLDASNPKLTDRAPRGQALMQLKHQVHSLDGTLCRCCVCFSGSTSMGHIFVQAPQPLHFAGSPFTFTREKRPRAFCRTGIGQATLQKARLSFRRTARAMARM